MKGKRILKLVITYELTKKLSAANRQYDFYKKKRLYQIKHLDKFIAQQAAIQCELNSINLEIEIHQMQ